MPEKEKKRGWVSSSDLLSGFVSKSWQIARDTLTSTRTNSRRLVLWLSLVISTGVYVGCLLRENVRLNFQRWLITHRPTFKTNSPPMGNSSATSMTLKTAKIKRLNYWNSGKWVREREKVNGIKLRNSCGGKGFEPLISNGRELYTRGYRSTPFSRRIPGKRVSWLANHKT